MNNAVTRGASPAHPSFETPVYRDGRFISGLLSRRVLKWIMVLLMVIAGVALYIAYLYPRAGYRDPLAVPFRLSGNFGELRSNHFHMGLDVRTNGKENLPVYAVADGYISRIIIEQYGLGKAVFVTHPNGYTTVYAHLNHFYDELETTVVQQQNAVQKREQDIRFEPARFPVSKGQLIARSGNTGASEAPHLHFEVRDTKTGHNLNPLLYGFDIADNKPPSLLGLYWYNRQYSTYRTAANSITLEGKEGAYQAARKVIMVRSPMISLGIRAEDKSNENRFLFGIYRAELRLDDSLVYQGGLDDFSYSDSRYINACVDYSKWIRSGIYVQHLAVLPGNHLPVLKGDGIIDLSDRKVHTIHIRISDVNNNITTLENQIQYSGAADATYTAMPGAIRLLPNKEGVITSRQCKLRFSKAAFYDTVLFMLKEQPNTGVRKASALISLHNATVPVHDEYTVSIKALPSITEQLKKKVVMQLNSGKRKYTAKGVWKENWLTASFNTLGTVQLLLDTIPPVVRPDGWENGQSFTEETFALKLACRDETDGIAEFRAELDGRWLLFERKGDDFTLPVNEECKPGKHLLTISITDVAGNRAQQTFSFVKKS